jgi:predicted acyltransferase
MAPTPGKRIITIDILRGITIFAMILCANIYFPNLPVWMFHGQTPPPDFGFDPSVKGITWVDLVFPFFLFTMGAAFPLAMRKRLDSGTSKWVVAGSLFRRWITLTIFAIALGNAYQIGASPRPDIVKGIFSVALWGVMFMSLVRVKDEKKTKTINNIGLFLTVVMGVLAVDYMGMTLSRWSSDVIIMILANVAIFGGLLWMFTKDSMKLRWLVLVFIIALKALSSYVPQALSWVPSMGCIGWFFSWGYLQYLVIALAGSIVGDMLLKHSRSGEAVKIDGHHLGAACIALTAMFVQLWGLFTRQVLADFIISAVLAAVFVAMTWKRRNIMTWLGYFGFAFMLVGIGFDPIDGGITKDYCNLSYMLTTTGMTALTGTFVLALELKWQIKGRGLSGCGQNPMLAYTVTTFLISPILAMCGIGPWLMSQGYSSPTWAMICGLTYTLLMVAVTCFFTKKKLFWRS